ncbi:MAG TPA: hypothetical protein PKD53_18095 [Chloroflexaceae bacterium]|nr:hypothetical protein [Chloroflexaceae bacterium]
MRDRRTYVLRVWIEPEAGAEGRPALRATLQPAEGGEPRPFGSLEQLADFIRSDLLGQTGPKEEQR